jgi:hypothetical protein
LDGDQGRITEDGLERIDGKYGKENVFIHLQFAKSSTSESPILPREILPPSIFNLEA